MIVVGIDDSAEAKAALRFAIEEARLRQTGLLCMHAWTYPLIAEPVDPPLERLFRREATELLESVCGEVAGDVTDVEIRKEAREGAPAKVLVAAAQGADLLVVGSRGRGGFAGLLLGSVSQQCVHHAACPVVIVRR